MLVRTKNKVAATDRIRTNIVPRIVFPLARATRISELLFMIALVCILLTFVKPLKAETEAFPLPEPMTLQETLRIARANRTEIVAARARVEAALERATVVSALEDPMLMPSIDHYPYKIMEEGMPGEQPGDRYDWSITIEQRFPLSRVRSHRRRGAEAEAQRLEADSDRVLLEVELGAIEAFLMLSERRRMLEVMTRQIELAEQMVRTANARYSSARGGQTDVLRAEVELARLQGQYRARVAEERGAQAMFNASLGRAVDAPVPKLATLASSEMPPPLMAVSDEARAHRPELRAGAAEIERAAAEVEVMRSMYYPMGVIRLGEASTMAEGEGAMLMVGLSIPLWRDKLRSGVSEARAMERMAHADFIAMRRMVESEAINAREDVIAARELYLSMRDEVVPRARMALEPALAAYSSGTTILATVIDAAQALWSAEAELVMAETNLGLAWARLERAVGRKQELLQ
jgi:outer membrane protein, heavy metal efflux system